MIILEGHVIRTAIYFPRGYILSTQLLVGVGFVQVVGWAWQLGFNFPRLLQMAWLCRSHPNGFDNLVRKV